MSFHRSLLAILFCSINFAAATSSDRLLKRLTRPFNASAEECVFHSQYNQDRFIFEKLLSAGLQVYPTYVDLAANEPVYISNSHFFDACLGWRGVCIEPDTAHHVPLLKERSCSLIPTCVSDKFIEVTFVDAAALGGILDTNKNLNGVDKGQHDLVSAALNAGKLRKLTCVPTQFVLDKHRIKHVGYFSLDVEGHELAVLQGIDWTKTKVDIFSLEPNDPHANELLQQRGYHLVEREIWLNSDLYDRYKDIS